MEEYLSLDDISTDRIRAALKKSLTKSYTVDDAKGLVSFPPEPLSVSELLIRSLPRSKRKKARDGITEDGGYTELLSRLDECPEKAVQETEIVRCWSTGDTWCLMAYRTPRSGYVVFHGTGDEDNPMPLLGVWQPVDNAEASRECVISCYVKYWKYCTLPPALGETASGEQPLWMECLLRLLKKEPELWKTILRQMPRTSAVISTERWEYVQELTGSSESRLGELFREAGFAFPIRDDIDNEYDLLTEPEEEAVSYDVFAAAAPFEEESASFLLANYCYTAEQGGLRDDETEEADEEADEEDEEDEEDETEW